MSSEKGPPRDTGPRHPGNLETFYTNEDIAVLHNIVRLAEELLPTLPERERLPTNALFGAYYEVLPKVGVNADHDSRYARILFKIGGLRGPGTIFEKFEEVLSRMGIEIEFDAEEGEESSQPEGSQANIESAEQEAHSNVRGRRRRDSESSAWDLGNGFSQRGQPRASSIFASPKEAPPSFPQNNLAQPQKPEARRSSASEAEHDPSGHNVRTWLASNQGKSHRGRKRSVSGYDNLQIRRRSLSSIPHEHDLAGSPIGSDNFPIPSEITAVTSEEHQGSTSLEVLQRHPQNNISEGLMQVKASLFLHHHVTFLAKRRLRFWRDRALLYKQNNMNNLLRALHHDNNVLLRLALEAWHNRLLEKRAIAETERFFAYLGRRSSRARDLYLLQKAFTHWRICAYDEVERTSIARRHIIRTRTFNAWRDITAVNELKVRRHVIKKFFSVWRHRYDIIQESSEAAVQKFEDDVVEKTYRKWIQKSWNIKSEIWWAERAQHWTLIRWSSSLWNLLSNHKRAHEQRHLQLALSMWRVWRAKTDERINMEHQANSIYQFRACSSALRRWRGETRVIPAKISLQADVTSRLLRDAFAIWLNRSKQARQAVATDRLRMLREAWTTWRHKVRFQILRARVDERITQAGLYKWILAERVVLSHRNLDGRLLQNYLADWVEKWSVTRKQRWDQEDVAQSFAIRKGLSRVLSRWHTLTRSKAQLEDIALVQYKLKLLQRLLSKWSGRTHHLRKINQWSRDAEFYFRASKSLRRWKASTENVQREKRKGAYTRVRRMTKMNLARIVLLEWNRQAQLVLQMQAQAEETRQNKIVIIGMNTFDRWRARTEELSELEALWRGKVLREQLMVWREHWLAFKALEIEANINHQERQQGRAVKKWSLLTLQLRSRSLYALEIREKNLKRSFRKTFSYWHQRTLQKRPAMAEVSSPGQLGVTSRAEQWSDFGDENEVNDWGKGLDGVNPSISIPGYLSTPSRRMDRVTAAAARFSSTTPRAPLSTPFERHLRAQYSGRQFSSLQAAPSRSLLGMGGGFADINKDLDEDYETT